MLGKRYPFDPPLTLAGTKQAKTLGKAPLQITVPFRFRKGIYKASYMGLHMVA